MPTARRGHEPQRGMATQGSGHGTRQFSIEAPLATDCTGFLLRCDLASNLEALRAHKKPRPPDCSNGRGGKSNPSSIATVESLREKRGSGRARHWPLVIRAYAVGLA